MGADRKTLNLGIVAAPLVARGPLFDIKAGNGGGGRVKNRAELFSLLRSSKLFTEGELASIKAAKPDEALAKITSDLDISGMSDSDLLTVLKTKPSLDTKKVTVSIEADPGDEVEVLSPQAAEPDAVEEMDEDEDEVQPKGLTRRVISKEAKRAGAGLAAAVGSGRAPSVPTSRLGKSIRQYDMHVKSGRPVFVKGYGNVAPAFSSGEQAAMYGAWMRKRLIDLYPAELGEYSTDADGEMATKALGTTVNNLGGALVPEDFSPDLIDLPSEYGAFRRAAGTTNMSRDTLTVPRVRNRFVVGDIGENSAISSQDKPTFDNVTLTAAKKGGIIRISNELLNDSAVSLGEVLARDIQRGFDKYIDDSALLGSNGYQGMNAARFTVSGTDHYDAALSAAWSEYTVATIEAWMSLTPTEAWGAGNVGIICHRSFYGAVLARFGASAAAVSDSGSGLYNSSVPLPSGVQGTYRGLPVYFTDSMPSSYSANQISAVIGSFSGGCKYGEVDGSDEITTSDQRYFEYDQVGFRALRRFAINTHNVGGSDSSKPSLVVGLKD